MGSKVFLITGASSGIGEATARRAAEAGFNVVLAARSSGKLESLSDELGRDRSLAVTCDVSSIESQQNLLHQVFQRFGRIDVVFANAGFSDGSRFHKGEADLERWREMVLVNVFGAAATARLTLPELVKSGGHILLTGSVAGRITSSPALYSATKWALTGIAQGIRNDVAGTGVRVTLLNPGAVETPFWDYLKKPDHEKWLYPDDVARAVLYAVNEPPHVDVNEILIRPTGQTN
ncbi:MAG: SDR family oxidoreductase [Chlorobiaceae bacterium]|nr:SDR family oxidoreductase [Chlorobiaceae bacterium]